MKSSESTRRSKMEILLTVLKIVRGGEQKPTKIMYAANMSWNLTQKVFADLVRQDLLEVESLEGKGKSTKRYKLSEKGQNVLDYFEGAEALLKI